MNFTRPLSSRCAIVLPVRSTSHALLDGLSLRFIGIGVPVNAMIVLLGCNRHRRILHVSGPQCGSSCVEPRDRAVGRSMSRNHVRCEGRRIAIREDAGPPLNLGAAPDPCPSGRHHAGNPPANHDDALTVRAEFGNERVTGFAHLLASAQPHPESRATVDRSPSPAPTGRPLG